MLELKEQKEHDPIASFMTLYSSFLYSSVGLGFRKQRHHSARYRGKLMALVGLLLCGEEGVFLITSQESRLLTGPRSLFDSAHFIGRGAALQTGGAIRNAENSQTFMSSQDNIDRELK